MSSSHGDVQRQAEELKKEKSQLQHQIQELEHSISELKMSIQARDNQISSLKRQEKENQELVGVLNDQINALHDKHAREMQDVSRKAHEERVQLKDQLEAQQKKAREELDQKNH